MPKPLKPIKDYYGTEITVEVVGASPGFMVDLDWTETIQDPERDGWFRLTAGEARVLAARLNGAAEEIESHS